MAKTLFFKLMDKKYGQAKNLSRLTYLNSVERAIYTKVFHTKYLKRKHYKISIDVFTSFQFKIIYTTVPSSSWLAKH